MDGVGIEPTASPMRTEYSTIELSAQLWQLIKIIYKSDI